jgi:FlaA1/EpsC-like NDP-sugar epimerase
MDIAISTISILLAYLIRFNFKIPLDFRQNLGEIILIYLITRSIVFIFARTYSGIIRYTSFRDIARILATTAIGTIILFLYDEYYFQLNRTYNIPHSVILIDFFILSNLLISARLLVKNVYFELTKYSKAKENILIYGSKELALLTKRAIMLDKENNFKVVGFIDDKKKVTKKKIEGIPIFNFRDIDALIEKYCISAVIFAKSDVDRKNRDFVVEKCLDSEVRVLTVPKMQTWTTGDTFKVNQIKEIKIEDLLDRKPINITNNKIWDELKGKVVLVTGAAGSIGSELVRQITKFFPGKIILFDQAESPLYDIELEISEKYSFKNFQTIIGDLTNYDWIDKIFNENKPDIVFHAAAYKHVPMMERFPVEAIQNNVLGTKILADASVKYNAQKFIMISTDKAVNPTNIMGASKRIAEMYTQSLNDRVDTNFVTTRFGNVLGSNGSVIPRFRKQIEEGGPITVTHPEITRYFMTIPEACQLVLEASIMGTGGEIFIFDMGNSVKIANLAKRMIKLSGLEEGKDVQIKYTGLRPGEKLYEELLCNSENTIPTYHNKIMIAKVKKNNYQKVNLAINKFFKPIKDFDNKGIVELMKLLVPEFVSQNSEYEKIDKQIEEQRASS